MEIVDQTDPDTWHGRVQGTSEIGQFPSRVVQSITPVAQRHNWWPYTAEDNPERSMELGMSVFTHGLREINASWGHFEHEHKSALATTLERCAKAMVMHLPQNLPIGRKRPRHGENNWHVNTLKVMVDTLEPECKEELAAYCANVGVAVFSGAKPGEPIAELKTRCRQAPATRAVTRIKSAAIMLSHILTGTLKPTGTATAKRAKVCALSAMRTRSRQSGGKRSKGSGEGGDAAAAICSRSHASPSKASRF